MLEYASKFIELSRFTPTLIANQRLKMNRFEGRLNPDIKERISVPQCTSDVNLYGTMLNVERAMKERNNYFNEQCRIKRKEDQRWNFHSQQPYERPAGHHYSNNDAHGG